MTERLDEHKMKYAVDTDKEAEDAAACFVGYDGEYIIIFSGGQIDLGGYFAFRNPLYTISQYESFFKSERFGIKLHFCFELFDQTPFVLYPFNPLCNHREISFSRNGEFTWGKALFHLVKQTPFFPF